MLTKIEELIANKLTSKSQIYLLYKNDNFILKDTLFTALTLTTNKIHLQSSHTKILISIHTHTCRNERHNIHILLCPMILIIVPHHC